MRFEGLTQLDLNLYFNKVWLTVQNFYTIVINYNIEIVLERISAILKAEWKKLHSVHWKKMWENRHYIFGLDI